MRTGYELPFGSKTGLANDAFGTTTTGFVPIWVDAGYRFEKHFALGAYFRYGNGHAYNGGGAEWGDCAAGGSMCTATDVIIGAQVHYHFLPDRLIDPWAGLGAGYEFFDYTTEGGGPHDFSFEGYDFFNLQAGVDFKPIPSLGVGPFATLTVGQFSTCSPPAPGFKTALHEWLAFGIRIAYDIKIPSFALPPPAAPNIPPGWSSPPIQ